MGHVTAGSQLKGVKPKMRERKLKSGVKWQEALKQKGIKQTGVKKKGLGEETTIRSTPQKTLWTAVQLKVTSRYSDYVVR